MKTLVELFKADRPNDKIIKVLSNKFLLAQCMYESGTFAKEATIFGLDNGKLFAYGNTDIDTLNSFKYIAGWIRNCVDTMPTVDRIGWKLNNGVYTMKTSKNKKYKQKYRRLLRLIA